MKKYIKTLCLPIILIAFMAVSQISRADDPPPPPPPGGGHGSTGNQGPMGAPIAGGVVVFLAFAGGMAGYEIYKSRKRRHEETT
jgi:hypothetical protein